VLKLRKSLIKTCLGPRATIFDTKQIVERPLTLWAADRWQAARTGWGGAVPTTHAPPPHSELFTCARAGSSWTTPAPTGGWVSPCPLPSPPHSTFHLTCQPPGAAATTPTCQPPGAAETTPSTPSRYHDSHRCHGYPATRLPRPPPVQPSPRARS